MIGSYQQPKAIVVFSLGLLKLRNFQKLVISLWWDPKYHRQAEACWVSKVVHHWRKKPSLQAGEECGPTTQRTHQPARIEGSPSGPQDFMTSSETLQCDGLLEQCHFSQVNQ